MQASRSPCDELPAAFFILRVQFPHGRVDSSPDILGCCFSRMLLLVVVSSDCVFLVYRHPGELCVLASNVATSLRSHCL